VKRGKEKIIFVLMGLVLGFALGVSILFWQQSLNLTQKAFDETKKFIVGLFDSKNSEVPSEKIIVKKKPNKKKKTKNAVTDTTLALVSQDSLGNYYIDPNDTLEYDGYSEVYASLNKNDGEEVARDRLLFKKQIEAEVVSRPANSNEKNIDSLLIGGKQTKEEKNKLNVEFWESPLNYKGYKKNKNYIVLYGIKQFDLVDLKYIRNDLYLCYSDNYYLLENSSDFKNLIPINNQQLINQLKEK